ncbi:Predicted protein [Klebsiella variicola]|nr:Predicted protein [Klebsiella variicola]
MNTQPVIDAGNLSSEELSAWLIGVATAAKKARQGYENLTLELQSAESSLRYAMADLEPRINFLASDQIIRSADRSTAIQAELDSLRVIFAAVRDSQQTILSSVAQLQQTAHSYPDLYQQAHLQECAEQESDKGRRGP